MGTKRLYLLDSHMAENDAVILTCAKTDGGYAVTVDECCLFPNAGGQPCDLGTAGTARVLSVDEKDGELVILTDAALPVGERVHIEMDWARRFDFMQQHTGEHLLSFVLYDLYGAANVGFHLAETYATIDMSVPLDKEQLSEAVMKTNARIAMNLPVTAHSFESEEALAASGLPLRKHAEGLIAPIRIVSIEGADACTCCAPHCKHTGEIGSVAIADAAPYKGGTRITFFCGQRAVAAALSEHALLDSVARRFSTARADVEGAIVKQTDALTAAKRQNKALIEKLNGYLAAELIEDAAHSGRYSICAACFDGMESAQLSSLSARMAEHADCVSLLFAANADACPYVLSASEKFPLDMGELAASVNAITGGRGGGRGTRAQGMAKAPVSPETLEQLRAYLVKRLK